MTVLVGVWVGAMECVLVETSPLNTLDSAPWCLSHQDSKKEVSPLRAVLPKHTNHQPNRRKTITHMTHMYTIYIYIIYKYIYINTNVFIYPSFTYIPNAFMSNESFSICPHVYPAMQVWQRRASDWTTSSPVPSYLGPLQILWNRTNSWGKQPRMMKHCGLIWSQTARHWLNDILCKNNDLNSKLVQFSII